MDSTIAQADVGVAEEFGRTLARVLPQVGLCVVILVVGYLLARLLSATVDRVLGRVGFDRAVVRGGVGRVLERTRYDPSDLLAKLVFWLVLLVTAQLAFGVFGSNPVSDLIAGVIAFLPNVFVAVVILVLSAALAALVRELVEAAVGGSDSGRTLAAVASAAVLVIGGFAAASQLRIAPAILNAVFYALLATLAGSAIVAIGGAGIVPLRARWERALSRLDEEAPVMRAQVREARETRRREAEARAARAREQREAEAREREALEAEARERAEREAREAQEAEARERAARERAEREAIEAEARAVREAEAREARQRQARETREAIEAEARAAREAEVREQTTTVLPVQPREPEVTQRLSSDDPAADDLTQPLQRYPDPDARRERGDD